MISYKNKYIETKADLRRIQEIHLEIVKKYFAALERINHLEELIKNKCNNKK